MRICLLANPDSIFIQRWSEFYIKNGHEIHIIYLRRIFSVLKEFNVPGVKLHPIKLLSNIMLNAQSFYTKSQLKKILKKIKPDILHVHYLSYHAWLAAKSDFHPLVVSAWGSDIYIEAENITRNRVWVETALNQADRITTTSKTMRKNIIQRYKLDSDKINNFYWGQDLTIFKHGYEVEVDKLRNKFGIDKDTFVVLSSRNMKPLYGIHHLIDTIPHVINKRKNVKFIILQGAGIDEYYDQLKKQVKNLNLEKYVIFVSEYLDSKQMAVYNNLADIIISLPQSDQFSGAVKEAMACGAIPIVHDLEVYHEHLVEGKNGFFVNRKNVKEIAQKIIYCIDHHPELKGKFAKINRKILEEKSDWNKNAKLMIKLYEELLRT